jgi:hypothetical protein
MTCSRDIMEIFRQNKHFSKILIIWEVRVQALVV